MVRSDGSKLLINRGWIAKKFLPQETRPLSLPQGEVEIECLLRKTPEKNFFTPDAPPIESPMYHFMDINDMSRKTDCQPIYIEELLDLEGISKLPDIQGEILSVEQIERRGIPVGSSGKVEFRNTHFQYILTWYGLSVLPRSCFSHCSNNLDNLPTPLRKSWSMPERQFKKKEKITILLLVHIEILKY